LIIHSIIPNEIIFAEQNTGITERQNIIYKGNILEVTCLEEDRYRIDRIISGSLNSYLDPDMQPGNIIRYKRTL